MEAHEAADIFPLAEDTLAELAEDIRQHGQQKPIELLDGKILDGRRRWRACQMAGVTPKTVEVQVSDPVAYALSLNLKRRDLDKSQRGMVAARALEVYERQAKERQREGQRRGGETSGKGRSKTAGSFPANLPESKGDARDLAGKAVGVSGKTVDFGTKVLTKAVPEVVKAVEEGQLAVSAAAKLADEPEEVQRREAASPQRKRRGRPPAKEQKQAPDPDADPAARKVRGKGIELAHEALNALRRILPDDPLRDRGLTLVMDWIKRNR